MNGLISMGFKYSGVGLGCYSGAVKLVCGQFLSWSSAVNFKPCLYSGRKEDLT